MYFSAVFYCLILAGALLLGLWQGRSYGGNHWAFFGTGLDALLQRIGLYGMLALTLPPAVVSLIAFARFHLGWGAVLAGATVALGVIIYFFSIVALD